MLSRSRRTPYTIRNSAVPEHLESSLAVEATREALKSPCLFFRLWHNPRAPESRDMKKPWHPFQPGQAYSTGQVVSLCDRRIDEGAVVSIETKRDAMREIEKSGHAFIVWMPTNAKGYGASPFNKRLWHTLDRKPLFPAEHRYHSPNH
jgi:hypothetical protein